jgi:hypothetical protein
MLTTVPIVAPAPGKPPHKPEIKLPIPWPINSLSDLCSVRVKLSAITLLIMYQYIPKYLTSPRQSA